jgi:hypothetical protein
MPHTNAPQPSSTTSVDLADEALRQRRDEIYTPLDVAVEELHHRRLRFAECTPGRDWLPEPLINSSQGFGLLARFMATPNFEALRFLNLVTGAGLFPVISGFAIDKFFPQNPLKRALARMGFHNGWNRHEQPIVQYLGILNDSQQGRPFGELKTCWGQDLISFHHEFFAHFLNGGVHPAVFDSSEQYIRAGGSAAAYYRKFLLRVCIADGILFDDYLLEGKERNFTRDVVLPAFDAVTAECGMRPLIVRLSPPEEEASPHWFWYPGEMKAFVLERMGRVVESDGIVG